MTTLAPHPNIEAGGSKPSPRGFTLIVFMSLAGQRPALVRVLPERRVLELMAASVHSVGTRNQHMVDATALERVLKRDRAIIAFGLVGIALLAWSYTILVAFMTDDMAGAVAHMAMPQDQPWSGVEVLLMFSMWVVRS